MELSGKYMVPLRLFVGLCYKQIQCMAWAWRGEWSFSNGSLHADGYNFNRFNRVAATGTYSFQYPDFEGMRRNNILKKWKEVHLIIVTMLGLPLRASQHQIISINMVV